MHPLDLVDAAPWRESVFTTYSLSLSFFEAVVLDRLVRGGGRNALILSDPEGVRAGLSEQGARRIGRDYELEPIACSTGVFHAKVNAFFHETDCHLLVGSGNLTFGGWGMNMEVFEHLHPSFAADAINDAAGFFDGLSISDNIRHGVPDRLEVIGANLRLAARGGTATGKIRFLHNLEFPIAAQLAAMANDLGGANRIVVISPFYDRLGLGLRYLSDQLACDDIYMHVHRAGSVRGLNGMNWPSNAIGSPVQVSGEYSDDGRLLHAKCFEITCAKGRLIVSGSANATRAALENGNVEAVVVRIQPDASVYWTVSPCTSPPILGQDEEEGDEDEKRVGIPAVVRFISAEPLLSAIDLKPWLDRLDWVILGGESGAGSRPSHPAWFDAAVRQCTDANVAVHFKQWGDWAPSGTAARADAKTMRFASGAKMVRVGKKHAGRLIGGRTWDELPTPRVALQRVL